MDKPTYHSDILAWVYQHLVQLATTK